MSYRYSLVPAAESSVLSYSDGEPSVMSKTTNMHNGSSNDESTTVLSTPLPSSLMSRHSPILLTSIADTLMWLAQVSPANPSVLPPEIVPPTKTTGICGRPPLRSLDEYSRNFAISKMSVDFCRLEAGEWRVIQGDLFHPTSAPYSETWPKQGMMQNGVCWELTMSVRGTFENDYGSEPDVWPTVTAQDNNQVRGEGAAAGKKDRSTTLGGAVRKWPTPSNRDWKGGRQFDTLEAKGRGANNTLPDAINAEAGKVEGLNPDWAEALMGWPIGWTMDGSFGSCAPDWDFDWSHWEPNIPRTMGKCDNRVTRIQAIGNGQVPLTMAVAWNVLTNLGEKHD